MVSEIPEQGRAGHRAARVATAAFASLCLLLLPVEPASAQCIRQSMANQDYCGPDGSRLSRAVPERFVVDFSRSCKRHDECYGAGGESIRQMIEQRAQASLVRATPEQKRAFWLEMANTKVSCDTRFYGDLTNACRNGAGAAMATCLTGATAYYDAVLVAAWGAFNRSVDAGFVCRTR